MKKVDGKGFTLIELLAVITIMGILMVVAIPAVSRTIENTRRDQFLDTAKQYVNAVKTMWDSNSFECITTARSSGNHITMLPSELPSNELIDDVTGKNNNVFYVKIDTRSDIVDRGLDTYYPILLEQGGKSSWGNKDLYGFVKIDLTNQKKLSITLTDGIHGIVYISKDTPDYLSLKRNSVSVELTARQVDVIEDNLSGVKRWCKEI